MPLAENDPPNTPLESSDSRGSTPAILHVYSAHIDADACLFAGNRAAFLALRNAIDAMLHEDPTRGGVQFPQSFLEFVDCRIAPVSVRLAMVDEPTMISMPLPHETGSDLGNNPLDERTPWEVLDDLLE